MHLGLDWAWSVPLIVLCVVVHVCGLWLVLDRVVRPHTHRRSMPRFAVIMATAVLVATTLHAVEGAMWAATYRMMGALEALNGMLLFGLTTAFLFAIIQIVSPLPRNERSSGRRMHPQDVA
jgi:ABC-type Co2+ transport system permease subunit